MPRIHTTFFHAAEENRKEKSNYYYYHDIDAEEGDDAIAGCYAKELSLICLEKI